MKPDEVKKRSVVITGHKTSVSLEQRFWTEIKRLADAQKVTLSQFVTRIDRDRKGRSLSSSLRIAVVDALAAELASALDHIAYAKRDEIGTFHAYPVASQSL